MKRLILWVSADQEAFLEEWLWNQGVLSVSSRPQYVAERCLEALVEDEAASALKQAARELSWMGRPTTEKVYIETVDEQEWQVRWRDNFQMIQVGRLRLAGEWERIEADETTLLIYPGQAFGTGQHETTQMILGRLQEMNLAGKRVLDAGCGTGILAIAAERLGAGFVFGFDADPVCRENMEHHLAMNRTQKTRLAIGTLNDFEHEPYDLILANITLNVLRELWPRFRTLLKPGGVLLSSGLLSEQMAEAVSLLEAEGFAVGERRVKGEWCLLEALLP